MRTVVRRGAVKGKKKKGTVMRIWREAKRDENEEVENRAQDPKRR